MTDKPTLDDVMVQLDALGATALALKAERDALMAAMRRIAERQRFRSAALR